MDRVRDGRGRRYEDGEIIRYGAGESWRPTPRGGDRSPRRARSPARDRLRSPRSRSPRPRSPLISGSDSYVPGRYQPRRRSRSGGDRYRRDRSRDRQSPRRRERTRSPLRRHSLSRRGSPGVRFDRPRSPRRDWNSDRIHIRYRNRDRSRDKDREMDRRYERRSRSPPTRERRGASPFTAARGCSYRPRSRSPSRRGDRYQSYRRSSPLRQSGISSTMTSKPASERASPQPGPIRTRSPPHFHEGNAETLPASMSNTNKDASRSGLADPMVNSTSPLSGTVALRVSPAGPNSMNRHVTIVSTSSPAPSTTRQPHTPSTATHHRSEVTSPTNPPSGPRNFVPQTRGGGSSRFTRGSWTQPPSRQISGLSPSSTTNGPSPIPTGPRSNSVGTSYISSSTQSRSFNPPTTGPSGQHGNGQRQTLTQNLMATMPSIVPGGKLDPSMTPLSLGVTRDLEPHYRKLREEEEKVREELRIKQEKLRKNLYIWNKMERDSQAWELRSDLSEKSMKNMAGEGIGGAAF